MEIILPIKPLYNDPAEAMTRLPDYARKNDGGMDCYAHLRNVSYFHNNVELYIPKDEQDAGFTLESGDIARIRLGWSCRVPVGYGMFLIPRSGLGSKQMTIPNSPGLVDHGYSGEVQVLLQNDSGKDFRVTHGMRICQMILVELPRIKFISCRDLPVAESDRDGGFGHTGGMS